MAITINRFLSNDGEGATLDFVASGDVAGEGRSVVVSPSGAADCPFTDQITWGGTESEVMVTGITAVVGGDLDSTVTLSWSIDGLFMNLPHGTTQLSGGWGAPTVNVPGGIPNNIVIISVLGGSLGNPVPYTLRLTMRKLDGFGFSTRR